PRGDPDKAAIAAVADRDQHVAHESIAADTLDWRTREDLAETSVIEFRQVAQAWRGKLGPRQEAIVARAPRELVPRADRQAVVAAVDPVADRNAELAGNMLLVLDRQVRNAAPCIEPVGCRKGAGRANIEAAPAGAAMVALPGIGIQIGGRKHLAGVSAEAASS